MHTKSDITNIKQTGFSLLEVLISILILGVGLLGLAALQTTSLKNNHSAQHRTTATVLSYDIIDKMRLNPNTDFTRGLADSIPAGGTVAGDDLKDWVETIQAELPTGQGAIALNGDVITVTIQWDDSRASGGSNTQQFILRAEH